MNCYLLHVPRLPSQPASSGRGWVIDFIWLELAWQYIAMTRINLSIIWISLDCPFLYLFSFYFGKIRGNTFHNCPPSSTGPNNMPQLCHSKITMGYDKYFLKWHSNQCILDNKRLCFSSIFCMVLIWIIRQWALRQFVHWSLNPPFKKEFHPIVQR